MIFVVLAAGSASAADGLRESKASAIAWITEARREETRAARVKQAVEWMAAGKPRHWKYQPS